jgi:hypothetical protein
MESSTKGKVGHLSGKALHGLNLAVFIGLGSRSGSFFIDSIDKPGFFKLVHKRKVDQPFGFDIYLSNRAAIDNLLNPLIVGRGERSMWLAYSCQFASSKLSSVICANLS